MISSTESQYIVARKLVNIKMDKKRFRFPTCQFGALARAIFFVVHTNYGEICSHPCWKACGNFMIFHLYNMFASYVVSLGLFVSCTCWNVIPESCIVQDEKRVPARLLQHISGRAVASSIGQDRYCKFAKVQDCTFDGPLS